MKPTFLEKLEALRILWGKPMSPTSGTRCAFWNKKVGGASNGQHLYGNAADFWFDDSDQLFAFIKLAEECGFGGVGFGKHLVHIDDRGYKARWFYGE